MGRKRRLRRVDALLAEAYPRLEQPERLIAEHAVLVDGRIVTNPASRVPIDASIVIRERRPLRGEVKLCDAVDSFGVAVEGSIALDVGAAAGGFTRVLLERGARRVYAVDAGHGQLVGSLRRDPRVVNLERTNLGDLNTTLVVEPVDLVTMDLSYIALSRAVPQLGRIQLADRARLLALVKPQFELGLARPPSDRRSLEEALERARAGIVHAGWELGGTRQSPVRGTRGSTEFFVYARRTED
jgi:23S rRNA (cytidine1920-2'-O)/16S rRNA (cytidine1409-2'-O)-methyltransferase